MPSMRPKFATLSTASGDWCCSQRQEADAMGARRGMSMWGQDRPCPGFHPRAGVPGESRSLILQLGCP